MTNITTLSYRDDTSWRPSQELIDITVNSDYSGSSSTNNPEAILSFINLLDKKKVESGLLPPGLRLLLPGCVIFERPPSMQLIQLIDNSVDDICELEENGEDEALDPQVFQIPVPWQLYIATYSTNPTSMYRITNVRMYFMNTPLNHPDVELYAPYIPNFFGNAELCSPMFNDSDEIERYPQDISGVIASAYDWVWNTGFNADLKECIDQTIFQYSGSNSDRINPIVKAFLKDENRFNFTSQHAAFYSFLSKYDLHDVVDLPWAVPSYAIYFDRDYEFIYNNDTQLLEEFRQSDYCIDNEDGDNLGNFKDWISNIYHIKKTYTKIIDSLFYWERTRYMTDTHYAPMLSPNNISLQNLPNFAQTMINSIMVNRSLQPS
jgi:hypothetical protein